MIDSFLSLKEPIKAVCTTQQIDTSVKVFTLTEDDWILLQEVYSFLKIFEKCIKEMQADQYPTLYKVIPYYFRMLEKLAVIKTEGTNQAIKSAASIAYSALNDYYGKTKDLPIPYVTIICNPRYKMKAFEWLWKDEGNASIAIRRARGYFKITYDKYKKRADDRTIEIQKAIDNPEIQDSQQDSNKDEDNVFFGFSRQQESSASTVSEVERWYSEACIKEKGSDIYLFWKAKGYDFRIIEQMARDHLAIPASSVPSECVFSTGGDIITKKRNRIGRESVRYLLCLRSWGIIPEDDDFDDLVEEEDGEDNEIAISSQGIIVI
jgi:hypothetical protein